jgi:GDPmannose 4,6-dehydratase
VDWLQGDSRKAREVIGWCPEVSFEELVREMVEHDMDLALQEKTLVRAGYRVAQRRGAYA